MDVLRVMSPVLVCSKWTKTSMLTLEEKWAFSCLTMNVLHQLLSNQANISTVQNPKERQTMKMTENDFYKWRLKKTAAFLPPVPKPTEADQVTNTAP